MTRYRVSFPIDAQSMEQAMARAHDCFRPRAAPTLDGEPPRVTVHPEPTVLADPGAMRWSWLGADSECGNGERDVTIAWEGTAAIERRRRMSGRGVVSLYRRDADPQVVSVYLSPQRMAELIRAVAMFPIDLMDRMAMDDERRRGLSDDEPTLTGRRK